MGNLWFVFTVGAAISWGLNYTMTEKVLHGGVSLFFLMALDAVATLIFLSALFLFGKENYLKESISLISTGKVELWKMVAYLISGFFGYFLVNSAIFMRNATSVSLIELSYPLFTIFFTWLLFREVNLNFVTGLGAMFIVSGIILIGWKG